MIYRSKCTIKRMAIRLRPNPLRELTALPRLPTWIYRWEGKEWREMKGVRAGR